MNCSHLAKSSYAFFTKYSLTSLQIIVLLVSQNTVFLLSQFRVSQITVFLVSQNTVLLVLQIKVCFLLQITVFLFSQNTGIGILFLNYNLSAPTFADDMTPSALYPSCLKADFLS